MIVEQISTHFDRKGYNHTIAPLQFHDAHATDVWVVIADWNDPKLEKLSDLLDSGWGRDRGVAIGFDDEYTFCHICGHAVYTRSHHNWNWFETNHDIICRECCETGEYDEEILEFVINDPDHGLHDWLIQHFEKKGILTLVQDDFESGMHYGQNDDPTKILKEYIEENPSDKFVFGIQAVSMFTTSFAIYKVMDVE